MDFLNYIDKETEITIDFSSIEISALSECEDVEDIDIINSVTMETYCAEISLKDYTILLTLEYHSTETNAKIDHIELLTMKGAVDYVIGAKALYELKRVLPDIPVYITPI